MVEKNKIKKNKSSSNEQTTAKSKKEKKNEEQTVAKHDLVKSNAGEHTLMEQQSASLAVKNDQNIVMRPENELMRLEKDSVDTATSTTETKNVDTAISEGDSRVKNTSLIQGIVSRILGFFIFFCDLFCSYVKTVLPSMAQVFTWRVFKKLCIMIRLEHTLFALPFAYVGLLIASNGSMPISAFILLTIAVVAIRAFAMTVNRIVDVKYDAQNPRTEKRALVTGEVTINQAKAFSVLSLIVFLVASAGISFKLLTFTPILIFLAVLYSYMKRFTWYCHFVLGAVLALAPIAGELSIIGMVSNGVLLLSFGILFWVSGFDILYSCQDAAFDKKHKLYSIPACFGIPSALLIAKFCHINTIIFFLLFGIFSGLGWFWYLVWVCIAGALLWEHTLLSKDDLSKMNQAFFVMNACISIAVLIGVFFG